MVSLCQQAASWRGMQSYKSARRRSKEQPCSLLRRPKRFVIFRKTSSGQHKTRFASRVSPSLTRRFGATELGALAMHDPTEGGLSAGLHELAEASGVALIVDDSAIQWFEPGRQICEVLGSRSLGRARLGNTARRLFRVNGRDCLQESERRRVFRNHHRYRHRGRGRAITGRRGTCAVGTGRTVAAVGSLTAPPYRIPNNRACRQGR